MCLYSQPPLPSDLFLAASFSLVAKGKLQFHFQRGCGKDLCETAVPSSASCSQGSYQF